MSILYDEHIGEYHSRPATTLSKSRIMDFAHHGPAWWKLRYIDGVIPPRESDAMDTGNALDHKLTGDPATFDLRYAVKPEGKEGDGRTKEGKAWAEANAGKTILSRSDAAILEDAVRAVRECPAALKATAGAHQQVTIRRHIAGLGIELQTRPDWWCPFTEDLIDLKKTRDLDVFPRQAIDLGYHLQLALGHWLLAQEGHMPGKGYLLAVEWERGARARLYEVPEVALADGWRRCEALVKEIAGRLKSGDWTDRQHAPEVLPLTDWQIRKMEAA